MKKQIKSLNTFYKFFTALSCLLVLLTTDSFAQKMPTKSPCVEYTVEGEHNHKTYYWKNLNSAECKSAIEALRPASLLIFGYDTEKDSSGDRKLQQWLIKIAGDPKWNAVFKNGLMFSDATEWLKEIGSWLDYEYNKIPLEIYGRTINAQEQTDYKAAVESKKMWYATLFLAEKEKLNKNLELRQEMIVRAFVKVLKRRPTVDEVSYWRPRQEIYREIAVKIKK